MPHKMIEHIEQSPKGMTTGKLVAAEHGLRGDTVGITRIITMILASAGLCFSSPRRASCSLIPSISGPSIWPLPSASSTSISP
ncbi:MAG: hypothetical protein ACLRWP_13420 [Bilophila wadsworthia]